MPVSAIDVSSENTAIFEVMFVADRPVFMKFQHMSPRMVAAFGAKQSVPYSPAEMVEFRFKGPICSTMGLAESWLSQAGFDGKFSEFRLKYWATRKFAVWVPKECADEFWHEVTELLKTHAPRGSKLYRRPVDLTDLRSGDLSGIITPPELTP